MRIQLVLFLVFAMLTAGVLPAHANVLQGVVPLQKEELDQLRGGFTLPDGLNLSIAIDDQVSLNGTRVATSSLVFNGTMVSTDTTGITTIQGNGGSTTVNLSSAGTAIITNTANNLTLDNTRTITINMSNAARLQMMSMHSLAVIQSQGTFARTGFH